MAMRPAPCSKQRTGCQPQRRWLISASFIRKSVPTFPDSCFIACQGQIMEKTARPNDRHRQSASPAVRSAVAGNPQRAGAGAERNPDKVEASGVQNRPDVAQRSGPIRARQSASDLPAFRLPVRSRRLAALAAVAPEQRSSRQGDCAGGRRRLMRFLLPSAQSAPAPLLFPGGMKPELSQQLIDDRIGPAPRRRVFRIDSVER